MIEVKTGPLAFLGTLLKGERNGDSGRYLGHRLRLPVTRCGREDVSMTNTITAIIAIAESPARKIAQPYLVHAKRARAIKKPVLEKDGL